MNEEQYLYERLRILQEQYHKDAEPLVKRLAQLKSLETTVIHMDVLRAQSLGLEIRDCPAGAGRIGGES